MTLDTHRRRNWKRTRVARVWLDGIEVTSRCFYADGRRGVMRLYLHDATGHPYTNAARTGIATEERRGHVRWGRRQIDPDDRAVDTPRKLTVKQRQRLYATWAALIRR